MKRKSGRMDLRLKGFPDGGMVGAVLKTIK
jgi:hypothetical protein